MTTTRRGVASILFRLTEPEQRRVIAGMPSSPVRTEGMGDVDFVLEAVRIASVEGWLHDLERAAHEALPEAPCGSTEGNVAASGLDRQDAPADEALVAEDARIAGLIGRVALRHRDDLALQAIAEAVTQRIRDVRDRQAGMSARTEGPATKAALMGQSVVDAVHMGTATLRLRNAVEILEAALERVERRA